MPWIDMSVSPQFPETTTGRPTTPAAEQILGKYFPVLDHGFISLVDYMGSDECIERAARVSYGFGTRQRNKTRGLVRYLRRHKHNTPSEMVELKFHCCMPMFVARQWIRHRTANVNEYSGRYSLMPMLFYTPDKSQLQTQSENNNQGRSGASVSQSDFDKARGYWDSIRAQSVSAYEWMTGEDIARELARIDLPLSTYTQWYWKIDLHNLLHFLTLRVDSHAQWEIQEYGRVMAGMTQRVAPFTYEAWLDYDVCGGHLSRMELDALRKLLTVEEDTLSANGQMTRAELCDTGVSKREAGELFSKLQPKPVPSFDLDLSRAKSPEFFREKFAAAVPTVDAERADT